MLTNNKKLILNGEYFSPLSYNNVPRTLFLIFYYCLFAITNAWSPLYLNMNAVQHKVVSSIVTVNLNFQSTYTGPT
jgi:hypothetical protein